MSVCLYLSKSMSQEKIKDAGGTCATEEPSGEFVETEFGSAHQMLAAQTFSAFGQANVLVSPHESVTMDSLSLFADCLRQSAKPESLWMCGVEFELFGYERQSLKRLDAIQVQSALLALAEPTDDLVFDKEFAIEARFQNGGRLTVEPGGQIEFSSAPRRTLLEIERDFESYFARLREISAASGFTFLAAGFDPLRTIAEQNWFPKSRYKVMRPFLAARGRRAWDMMTRTCAVQVNLDYSSESDLAKKFIAGNRLAPVVTAIFANSPFEDGQPSGYKSTRAAAWLETDAARSSVSPLALRDDFSFAAFIDYALDVPMIFVRRGVDYLAPVPALTFRVFLERGDDGFHPIFQDWTDHLTTIFTEARIKQYIELRSADTGPLNHALALQALWKGLLYERGALDGALSLAPKLNEAEMYALSAAVARDGLAARASGVNVLGVAKDLISIAARGLESIAPEEVVYLEILREQVVEDEMSPADILLKNWNGSWHASLARLVEHLRIA